MINHLCMEFYLWTRDIDNSRHFSAGSRQHCNSTGNIAPVMYCLSLTDRSIQCVGLDLLEVARVAAAMDSRARRFNIRFLLAKPAMDPSFASSDKADSNLFKSSWM